MKTTRIASALAIALLLAGLVGCATTVRTAPPPPPHRVDVRPPPPFVGAIWIDGHYIHRHGRYEWKPGRYVRPPRSGVRWVPGRWNKHRRGWRWQKGHWDKHDRDDDRYRRDRDDDRHRRDRYDDRHRWERYD